MNRKPFKFTPEQLPALVQPETTVFNLVSDNPMVNGLALAFSSVASVVVIAVTIAPFFG